MPHATRTPPPGIETAFTRMVPVDYPIIGAPMFLVSYEELAVAVSAAGGLGTLALPNYRTPAELKAALGRIRQATQDPIGVNIHLSGRFPWKEQLAACLDAGVEVFITSLGDPRLILDDVHRGGGRVLADVVTIEQGLKAAGRGIDGLIAVAEGAGGHAGTIPLMVFVPALVDKVDLPVIAAGGISTGAQMAAALALGACAVVVGTRLVATPEARAVPAYKEALIKAGPQDIVYTDRMTGNPANWLAPSIQMLEEAPELGSRRWRDIWSAGKSVAQIESLLPASEIIHAMAAGYRQVRACLP